MLTPKVHQATTCSNAKQDLWVEQDKVGKRQNNGSKMPTPDRLYRFRGAAKYRDRLGRSSMLPNHYDFGTNFTIGS